MAVLPALAAGTNDTTAFDSASRLYEQGQYRAAAAAYGEILGEGRASSALYFNLGNAWFKAGEAGRAILNYRLAERLAPRDPDIRANLRMTRELVRGDAPAPVPAWRRWMARLTLDEWTLLAGALVWLCFGALALAELRPARAAGLRRLAAGAGGFAVLAGLFLGAAWQERRGHSEAVVVTEEAVVRYGPIEVSPELAKVVDGTELSVLDRKDGWLQVTGIPRGPGWLQERDVILLPP